MNSRADLLGFARLRRGLLRGLLAQSGQTDEKTQQGKQKRTMHRNS
jgi:hypothetical protein